MDVGDRARRWGRVAAVRGWIRCGWILILACAAQLGMLQPAEAGPLEGTRILDVRQGSARSTSVRAASRGGYELAGGEPVAFSDWYSPKVPELNVDFLTPVQENIGLIWGFGTGEAGEKYSITPGVRLGFVASVSPTPRSTLSLTAVAQFGADLSERPCVADYGQIGGVQRVNCRLAASTMAPEDTLKHRLSMRGFDDSRIALRYEIRF